jgi:lipopolysaccharide export system permease protein
MRLLTRYVLSELIKVFLIALTGMTLFMVMVGVSREAYSQGLGLKQILLLIPYILPDALRFAVPGTILFAACSTYGRLAAANEVVAIKAQGISPMAILWPVFIFAFLVSLVGVWLNDLAASWGREGTRRVVIESVEEIVYKKLQQQRSYSSRQFAINVKGVEGKKLIRPTFTFAASDDSPGATISSQDAELRTDLVASTLTLLCHNSTIDVGGERCFYPDTFERVVPLDEASRRSGRSAADIALSQIPQEIRAQKDEIDGEQQRMALMAGEQMIRGDFAGLAGGAWSGPQSNLQSQRVRYFRLLMEPQRRWANGLSCLCFVLIGAPMAILMRNADFLTSFFVCFVPILLIYYPLLIVGVDQAKLGTLPPWSVWTGNAILALCGIWLMRRVIRY